MADYLTDPQPGIRGQNSQGDSYMAFEKFISLDILRFVYAFVAVLLTAIGLIVLFVPPYWNGIAILVGGNLAWRLVCEGAVVFFSMHDQVVAVRRELEHLNQAVADSLKLKEE